LAAGRAVKDKSSELPFEVCLHIQKFEPEHLRVESNGVGASGSGSCIGIRAASGTTGRITATS
jgi:hypothetical protein